MKFKVGDRVEAIKKDPKGKTGTIVRTWNDNKGVEVIFDNWKYGWGENGCHYNMLNDEIKLIKRKQFTKSDLKDGDIVTYRNGEKRYVDATNKKIVYIDNHHCLSFNFDYFNEDLTYKAGDTEYDIIKIECPIGYKTVFERKEILDETEKRYLRDVIRPFRDKVIGITKRSKTDKKYCYIKIRLKYDEANLPDFEANTMYKNMEADKTYTLEELGL